MASAATEPKTEASERRIDIEGHVRADLPLFTFTLVADPGTQTLIAVRRIEVRRAGADGPMQRIEGLSTATPWSPESPGFEVIDMNFDGYADIRLVEARAAGPNLAYLNWLYDPAGARFVASPALDAITSPRFDAAAREIRSTWRDGASRQGSDVYAIRDGQPLPLTREVKDYSGPGEYTLHLSRWVDGAWQEVATRAGRDR